MNPKFIKFFIVMLSSVFLISSLALAGSKGKNKSKSTPPGWEKGQKTGWKGEEKPPGLSEDKIEKKHKGKMNESDHDEAADVKEKAEKKQKKHKEQYESEIETEKQKRDAELETEKEKIKSRTKKKDS